MCEIFGNNKPRFTTHFLERYAERIFHVKRDNASSWIKHNYNKFYTDLFHRLNNSVLYTHNNTEFSYISKKYGDDVRLLRYNQFIFVVRDFQNIVTFMRITE
jgi:hypothetical protein